MDIFAKIICIVNIICLLHFVHFLNLYVLCKIRSVIFCFLRVVFGIGMKGVIIGDKNNLSKEVKKIKWKKSLGK